MCLVQSGRFPLGALYVAFLAALLACAADGPVRPEVGQETASVFRIVETAPTNGARGIAIARPPISIVFSQPLDHVSVDTSRIRIRGVPAAVSTNGHTVTLLPVSNFVHGTSYTVLVGTGVRDTAGNILGREFRFSFMTKIVPP